MNSERTPVFSDMCLWTISRRSVVVLLGVLIVIALVLVLPQVDLLDTAFQSGTAPIVVHAQGTAKPAWQPLAALFVFFLFATGIADRRLGDRLLVIRSEEVQVVTYSFRC